MKKTAVFILFLILASTAWGQVFKWTGASGLANDWEDPDNWTKDGNATTYPPGQNPNDVVILDSSCTIDISVPNTVIRIRDLEIANGCTVTITRDMSNGLFVTGTLDNAGTLNLNGSQIDVGTFINSGTFNADTYTSVQATDTITNNGTFNAGTYISVLANTITNNGTFNADTFTSVVANTITNNGTFIASTDGVVRTSTITNSGTLNLRTADIAGAITNTGLIRLQGSQNVNIGEAPLARIGGTIQYQGNTPSWPFGYSYTNLTIDSTSVMGDAVALDISGDAIFSSAIKADSLTVGGSSIIEANITTTGNQTYTGAVTLGGAGARTLTSTTGSVTLGTITGNGNTLTISGNGVLNGGTGINTLSVSGTTTINGDITTTGNQTYTGAVTLGGAGTRTLTGTAVSLGAITGNNRELIISGNGTLNGGTGINTLSVSGTTTINGDITTTGNQSYAGVTLTGTRILTSSNGSITISGSVNCAGIRLKAKTDITTNGITASGNVKMEADGDIIVSGAVTAVATTVALEAGGDITINNNITANQLTAIATGVVNAGAVKLITSSTGIEGTSAAIYIKAENFTITATVLNSIIPGAPGGQLCLDLNREWKDTNNVIDGVENVRWHQHYIDLTGMHLVYGASVPSGVTLLPDEYIHILNNDFKTTFVLDSGYDVYINDADITTGNTSGLIFKTSGSGVIEFSGTNKMEKVTLESGNSGIRIVNSDITITDSFELTHNEKITLDSSGTGESSIKAKNITLNNITAANGEKLTLTTTSANIIVNGAVGTSTNRLGDIIVDSAGNVTLSGDLFANSVYVKSNGAININADVTATAAQIYTGTVTLGGTGVTRTLTGSTIKLGAITGGGKSLTITGNGNLNNGGSGINALFVGGDFSLTGSPLTAATINVVGTSDIAANITTNGANPATAPIYAQNYTGAVTLDSDVNFTGIAGSTIRFNDTVNGTTSARDLTITNANVIFNSTVGAPTTFIKNVNVTAGNTTINDNITATGNQNYGNGTVTITGSRTLTGAGGSITANGIVSGTDINFNALQGISLVNAANALAGNIILNNTQTGAVIGDITFTNTSTLTSLTSANNSASGKIIITQTGSLPINSLQTGASGSISIKANGTVTQTSAIGTANLTVEAGTGITLPLANTVTTAVDLTNVAGNIEFNNDRGSTGTLNVTAVANNGNVIITEKTGGFSVKGIDAVGKSVSLSAAENITQTKEIKATALTLSAGTGVTLALTNVVTTAVDLTKVTGNIEFNNDRGSAGALNVTAVANSGNLIITEKTGGLVIGAINNSVNVDLKAKKDISTQGINYSGFVNMKADGNITVNGTIAAPSLVTTDHKITLKTETGSVTVTGKITAYQLIAKACYNVTVKEVEISLNIGDEGESAAIYIKADNFIVTQQTPNSIVPGGTLGQLCLVLNKRWTDTNNVVDGVEDVRWHQHYIDLAGMHLVYGDDVGLNLGAVDVDYIIIRDDNKQTRFVPESGYNIYINNADITPQNIDGLIFETSGLGTIEFSGTNGFSGKYTLKSELGDINLDNIKNPSDIIAETISGAIITDANITTTGKYTLRTESGNINLNNIGNPSDIIAETGGSGAIIISANINTTGVQTYTGNVTLGNNVTLQSGTAVTLGTVTGGGKSLTITGNGTLNGGSGINALSATGGNLSLTGALSATTVNIVSTSNITGNITTTGAQTYTGAVTLGGNVTLASNTGLVTLGAITGGTRSLTISGNGAFNGAGTGISNLSVSGTFNLANGGSLSAAAVSVTGASTIAGNITTTGTQTYTGAVTLVGTNATRTLTGSVTLGTVTGGGNSLTITGNGTLNGGSGINALSVSGTFNLASGTLNAATVSVTGASTIAGDIITTGNQTYTGAATLNGTDKRTITSQNGNIVFSNTLASSIIIELLAAGGNITISGATTAKQLIAKALKTTGLVTVNRVTIDSSTTGREDNDAAIFIDAYDFKVIPTTASFIVPGNKGTGQWGQLCLKLGKAWENTNNVVDGPEDTVPPGSVSGARWHQHFTVIPGKILYSFTEDSNGNGKLDRIRVQTNKSLNGNFTGFDVTVKEYEIDISIGTKGFQLVSATPGKTSFDNDSFYIYLIEKPEPDSGNAPEWSVTGNSSLKDVTGIFSVGSPLTDINIKPVDTIPPYITYTLTLPGHPQTYAQMSESVNTSGASASFGSIGVFPAQNVLSTSIEAASTSLGYIFKYTYPYGVNDLANNTINSPSLVNGYFRISNIIDTAPKPNWDDIKTANPGYPPKYPLDWSYTAYAKVIDNTQDAQGENGNIPFINVKTPPNAINPVIRRITDVLISRSPSSAFDNNYFAWPIWAKPSEDNNSVTEFDGSKYLEKDAIEKSGIELQARISNSLTITPQLFWTIADIPANMRNPKEASDAKKVGGLWLPDVITDPSYYYLPNYVHSDKFNSETAVSSSKLFNYEIDADKLANSGVKFEFIFRSSGASDMFIARLDAKPGEPPSNWYTLIRPFGFNIQGVRYQRGGVTILNNVINSDNKETAIIRYDLPRVGKVTVQIYTLDGTLIKSIRRNENREAGAHVDTWDGSNNGGKAVARGMYFVRVVGPDIDEIRKIMVVK